MQADLNRICSLASSEAGLASLLDEIPHGVALIDAAGRVALVNRAYETLTGMDRHQAAGLGCLHVLRCNFCVTGCPVQEKVPAFEPVSTDADIINRDRKKVAVRVTVARLSDSLGRPAGFLETVEDLERSTLGADLEGRAYAVGALVGKSPQIERIFRMVPSVAQTDSSVLITGETGTGKDLLAEAIHKASERARGPFVKVNCGALPDTLLESELFGHTKGAFTGADRNKPGRFKLAHGGTLFLTEIGDLPLTLQVKLLSFLDDHVIYPLGSAVGFNADVRIVGATHRDLENMVAAGRFRKDLLFRLNVIRLHLPPLRERGEDLVLLKGHFLREYCARFNKNIQGFSERAEELLMGYPFPGNVRELRNIVEYAVNFCQGDTIGVRHLPAYLAETPAAPPEPARVLGPSNAAPGQAMQPPQPAAEPGRTWEETERRMILDALVKSGGRKGRAAELLGWGRSTLWRKLKHHDIT